MRALACGSVLLAASFASAVAFGQAPPPPAPEPPPPPEPAPPAPEPAAPTETVPAASTSADDSTPPPAVAPTAPAVPNSAPLETRRPGSTLVIGSRNAPPGTVTRSPFERDFDALPLTLEARFGFNTRLGSSFDDSVRESLLGPNFAFAGFLAWKPEYSLGVELEHSGLGRVRALSGQEAIDVQYSATGAWFAARVFPIRRERLDVFVNLRIGAVVQHLDAIGTRLVSSSNGTPAQAFKCSEWDGPGIGLGGAIGLSYRLSRHVSLLSRLDATGHRLSGDPLGNCAEGIGSVASVGANLGLAYEFETSPK